MSEARAPRRARRIAPSPTALVLLGSYAALSALYLWQAMHRGTPTLFTDELELSQLSRAISETGHAALRGATRPFPGLSAYLLAPWWWIDDVGTAYAGIKYTGVFVMTATIFPAFGLGRLVLTPPWAVLAAVASVAAPALSYSPFVVEEPLAYPLATVALLLVARLLARPSWRRGIVALAACFAAYLSRFQLAVLLAVFALAVMLLVWQTPRFSLWRARWTAGDWIGAAVLAAGGLVVLNQLASQRSDRWYVVTTFYKGRLAEYALSAAGALTIGLGILPVVAGLAVLARRPRASTREERAFATTAASAIAGFALYAGVKAAYLSTVFANLVVERNLIYVVPLLFVGAALAASRADVPPAAAVASGALVLYLVVTTPYLLATYPNYEAHGLAILALANRELRWPDGTIQAVLVAVTIASTLAVVALRRRPRRPSPKALVGVLVAAVLVWNLTAEIYAARGENGTAKRILLNLPRPPSWVDDAVGPQSRVAFLGQRITDPTILWELEFWNRSVREVWSLDATAPGPGPTTTPDLLRIDGTITGDAEYVVADAGIELANPRASPPRGSFVLYRTAGRPRLALEQYGVYADGWMGASAVFVRYALPRARGFAKVTLSRTGWCGKDVPGTAIVRIGPLLVDSRRQPAFARVTEKARAVLHSCTSTTILLRAPARPWRVDVKIQPTFVPHELDPQASGDSRQLGAQVGFGFVPIS